MILSFNSVLLILLTALILLLIVERSVMRVSTTITSTYGKLDTGKRNQVL